MNLAISAKLLGQRVRQLRIQGSLTQQDLAGDDYSKSYISAIEQGKTRPSLEALLRLAARLNVPAGTLLDPAAQGFVPPDPATRNKRIRRPRGSRAKGRSGLNHTGTDLVTLTTALLLYSDRPQEALDMVQALIPEDLLQGEGLGTAGSGKSSAQLYNACRSRYCR